MEKNSLSQFTFDFEPPQRTNNRKIAATLWYSVPNLHDDDVRKRVCVFFPIFLIKAHLYAALALDSLLFGIEFHARLTIDLATSGIFF